MPRGIRRGSSLAKRCRNLRRLLARTPPPRAATAGHGTHRRRARAVAGTPERANVRSSERAKVVPPAKHARAARRSRRDGRPTGNDGVVRGTALRQQFHVPAWRFTSGRAGRRARKALGYAALALTDECSLAGIVRAHAAAREAGLPLVVGSEFRLVDGLRFVALATSRRGYAALSRLITRAAGRRRKGNTGSRGPTSRPGWRTASRCGCRTQTPAIEQGEWLRERFEGSPVGCGRAHRCRPRQRAARAALCARARARAARRRGRRRAHAPAPAPCDAGRADRRAPEDDRRACGPCAFP